MNRKQLLDMLRKQFAYAGKPDLAEVKAFVADPENGINLVDTKGVALDIETVWNKTVTVAISADAGEEVNVQQASDSEVGGPAGDNTATQSLANRKSVEGAKGKAFASNAEISAPAIHQTKGKAKRYNEMAAKGLTSFASADACEAFGDFCRKIYLQSQGKSQSLGTNSAGGYSVPTDVMAELISNRVNAGVARQVCRHFNIKRDKANVPVRSAGYTVYAPGENTNITASDATFGVAAFDAIQMGVLVQASIELMHDSVLDFGAFVADEMTYALNLKEDEILFAPVGTATTFGEVSIPRAIYNQVTTAGGTWTTDSNKLYCGTVTNADGNAWSEITLANLKAVPGKLPDYAHANASWVCSQAFWGSVMAPLAYTVGGTSTTELINGVARKYFMGYPVFVTSKMPTAEANSQIACLFGDFSRTAGIADVADGFSIDVDKSIYFPAASLAFRALRRVSHVVYDVGTANSSAASQVPGPMAALATLNA